MRNSSAAKKGYGFIVPEDGSHDVFVHQTAIHASGFRSLAEGEPVEYTTFTDDRGKIKAERVTGPMGAFVQGAPRRTMDGGFGFGGGGGGGFGSTGGGGFGSPSGGGFGSTGGSGFGESSDDFTEKSFQEDVGFGSKGDNFGGSSVKKEDFEFASSDSFPDTDDKKSSF